MNKTNRQKMKYLAAVLLLFAVCLFSAGCSSGEWVYDPITNVNNLEGRRVGVNLAWEADYYLSDRTDMELVRYDNTADMVLALKYDKIDAIALDAETIKVMKSVSEGVEIVEPAVGEVGSIMYFGSDDESLVEDFNKFLVEFKKTGGQEDLEKRLDAFDGSEYIGADIPLTGNGKVLRVAYGPDEFPRVFLNPGEDIPVGYDTEVVKLYANDRNYRLEFYPTSYDDSVVGLQTGKYDILTGYLSDVYADDVKAAGMFTSDPMFMAKVYLIEKYQKDITSNTEMY